MLNWITNIFPNSSILNSFQPMKILRYPFSGFTSEMKLEEIYLNSNIDSILIVQLYNKKFYISKIAIKDFPFQLELKKHKGDKFFLNRNPIYFDLIKAIILAVNKITYNKQFNSNDLAGYYPYYKSLFNKYPDKIELLQELIFYFKEDYEKIMNIFSFEISKNKINPDLIEDISVFNSIKSDIFEILELIPSNTKKVLYPYNQKGLFVQKNGYIIIEFIQVVYLYEIQVKPFICDNQIFDYTKCKNLDFYAQDDLIQKSQEVIIPQYFEDKANWKYIGTINFLLNEYSEIKNKDYLHKFRINHKGQIKRILIADTNLVRKEEFSISYIGFEGKKCEETYISE